MIEQTVDVPLPTEGAVPPALEGLLVRNGPTGYLDDATGLDSDGMVHAVELRGGLAAGYRNRWVRTRKLAAVAGTPPPRGPAQPFDGSANVSVVWHAGALLALDGVGLPHRLTAQLDTVGVEDFDGMLTSPVSAHPHHDPETGSLTCTGTDVFGPPFLRYHELDADGVLVHSTEVPVEQATYQPGAAVTATRLVVLQLPLPYDGAAPFPYRWDDDAPTRVGVLDRGAGGAGVRWADTERCAVLHVVNAFDDGATVVLDLIRHDAWVPDDPLGAPAVLERWRCTGRAVLRTTLDDLAVELPRVDPVVAGRPYRFAYCVGTARGDDPAGTGRPLVRYDLARDERAVWDPGPGRSASEPVFVRDPDGHADDEGWVLAFVDDAPEGRTDLVVLDASSFGRRPPDAVVHLPHAVPSTIHGTWVPAH